MMWVFTGGLPETECGAGSTLANTETVREWLPRVLRQIEAKLLLDIPCGDFNWMSRTDLSMVDYLGCDNDKRHIYAAMGKHSPPKFRPRSTTFMRADLFTSKLFEADVILCRDFFQHLPLPRVVEALERIQDTGARYMIATSHGNETNQGIGMEGDFSPVNLMVPPFNLPFPLDEVEDCGRILGLWRLGNE